MDDVSLKVFVGSIDFNATEKDIEEAFKPYGEVMHVILLRDKETQKSRGFGFVTFKERYSVEAAIKGMNKQLILGRPVVVNYAEKKSAGSGGGGGGAAAAAGGNAAANNPGNFGSQQNYGYGYGQQQQGQQNPYFPGYQAQQGFGGWNQQGYNWGYWPQQGYGGWGQGWNQQMQQQYGQQAQQQSGQQQSQGDNQGFPQNQSFNNNNSNYTNTSQSGF